MPTVVSRPQTSPNRDEEERRWEPLILDSLVLEELPDLSIRERMLGMNVSHR